MFIASRREIDSDDLQVTRQRDTGPATIEIGADHLGFFIMLDTPADCDALIKAAVEAKRLLSPPVITDSERDLPKVYVSPCNDEPGHERCSGISGLCDCDCHAFAASVMAS